ncbi:uncharacterized protein BDZ99DRAFT_303231 [Mytilinidion resinicola]|uniref:Cation chloride cotransporter-like protein n=1 Tax=Mytilinidion resinicola TaxID=574789 RepID=A0A6A6YQA2_9PEZI|nr:uncharacterized protein BDZ99DRAFT_303231 [Mytilinidion resinicola]KAF2810067.1 hypothetical protein BDZ99DRAFT_303231 [Mytilinidion resinicola]
MSAAPQDGSNTRRRMPPRTHSTFLARTARDDAEQLARRSSIAPLPTPSPNEETPLLGLPAHSERTGNPYEPVHNDGTQEQDEPTSPNFLHKWLTSAWHISPGRRRTSTPRRKLAGDAVLGDDALTAEMHAADVAKRTDGSKPRPGAFPRPVGGTSKLGTFAGVFVPTTLNVLSILMFLRFGFILGQGGVLGMMGLLIACYAINLLTTMSISAIATNGTVRGGGAYYLISRSLGPEFGGSIGIVFYLGFVFNTSMNAVGLIDCFIENFGSMTGGWHQWMPEGFWWQYLWSTVVLLACTGICLAGSGLFARASNGLLAILLIATFSIPFSALIMSPFESRREGIQYTGLSLDTFRGNLMPALTKGAAGSQLKGRENFQDLFGILFPATGGIFAGASMSGDLKHPSKAIPKGTLYGLLLTFVSYTVVILSMAATITRASFYRNTNVIQLVNVSGVIILLGEFATSLFSVLMGVIGSAKLLQALARDHLIPGLSVFGQGTAKADEPTYAIFITYVVAQLTMLSDINQIASFITMTYLMTFLVTNLACFLLKISSAPNFRPSFHYFNWLTAAIGTVVSGATMFFVDQYYASACVAILIILFLLIHYTTPPKPWGDVSQSLIYHQVRKYLLRLRQEHVKFWRPQILLFVNDPRRQYKLIQFCNSLKKGALFVLGHVIVTQDFGGAVPEARRQQTAWTKYIDFSKIKAFINIAVSPAVEWGARNIVLSAGLGGMRPNIVVMGFYNLGELRESNPLIEIPSPQHSRPTSASQSQQTAKGNAKGAKDANPHGRLPTDTMRRENAIGVQNYVTILEDLLLRLQINVAVAKGFQDLEMPGPKPSRMEGLFSSLHFGGEDVEESSKKHIDMWPIQMSAEISTGGEGNSSRRNVLTTNFDTYTLILQLGCILNTVPSWKREYRLRVAVFVEYESDVEEERGRVTALLTNLRIQAEVLVFWLACGDLKTYEVIINGNTEGENAEAAEQIDEVLREEEWWQDVQKLRGKTGSISSSQELARVEDLLGAVTSWPTSSFVHGRSEPKANRFEGLKKMLRRTKRKASISDINQLGANIGMRTHRLAADLVDGQSSESEDSFSAEQSDDEAVHTESKDLAASENDLSDYDLDASDDERPITPVRRTKSMGASMRLPFLSRKFILRKFSDTGRGMSSATSEVTPLRPHPDATASDTALVGGAPKSAPPSSNPQSKPQTPGSSTQNFQSSARPPMMRNQSMPKFSSKPVPRTKIATEDGPGPSIMFTDQPSPDRDPGKESIYHHPSPSPSTVPTDPFAPQFTSRKSTQATGFPLPSSLPLSFNDLPCRAQHLILNELMRTHSGSNTAVLFTTLPSPLEGTCESEADSVRYLGDLEVLCQDLPPALLVHSNSMTVTMNL